MTSEEAESKEEKFEISSESAFRNEIYELKSNIEINPDFNKGKVLRGKALQIYWYILTHKHAGVREIQKSLNFSSPGTVSYQIKKLSRAGIIKKNEINGKYYPCEESKKGMLGFYIRVGYIMVPRFSLYLIFYILGFIAYLFLASVYGDDFITHPGGFLFLIFLIFGTGVFILESIKLWKRRPTKLK
ncbi:MAG: hypothetical protein ACFFBY_13785 [Promethearchaeota archaeon]